VAVFLALAMRSMQIGSYDKMISDVVEQYTGYVQVHATGYWDDQTIENIFALDSTLIERLAASEHVTGIVPRLESFALASSGPRTRGAQVVGTDPEADDSLTALRGRLTKGTFIRSGDSSALLAGGLATYLGLAVGDTLLSQPSS